MSNQMSNQTKKTVLYIDGQNFTTRIRSILRRRGIADIDLVQFDFWGLLGQIFKNEQVDLVQIYFAKLHAHKETAEKSEELLKREDELKTLLEQQGIKYITAGSVRPRKRGDEIEFVEKGVDIRIAVDMVTDVIDGTVSKVLLASSDSDMQPAIYEMKRRGAEVWYVGFASRLNRGLMLTTDRYVLIENADIERFYGGEKSASPIPSRATTAVPVPQSKATPSAPQLHSQHRTVLESKSGSLSHRTVSQTPQRVPQTSPEKAAATDEAAKFNMPPWTRKNL